jgi:hypothetical protein
VLAKRTRGAAEFAEARNFKFTADEQRQMPCHHCAEAQPSRRLGMNGIEANKIAVIHKLAAGLATSIETCIALGGLAMKC